MRIATRQAAVARGRVATEPLYVLWEHDGENVSGFILDVDGTEHDLGALSPYSGTTYRYDVSLLGVGAGVAHDITVIAYNGAIRADAAEVTLTW